MKAHVEAPTPSSHPAVFLRRLLVPIDASEEADRVVSFAIDLALRYASDVEFCCAVDEAAAIAETTTFEGTAAMSVPLIAALDDMAGSITDRAVGRARGAGLVATASVLHGAAAEAIFERSRGRAIDAIVVGTEGKHGIGRALFGSTADGVLRRCEIPVCVVPLAGSGARWNFGRMLVAVDDSDPSDAAAAFATAFASGDATELLFCGVAQIGRALDDVAAYGYDPTPIADDVRTATAAIVTRAATRATDRHVRCESIVADGDPADEILDVADARDVGTIVIGTHGRRGVRRWFLGSVAERVVARSRVPVIVLRAGRTP